MTREGKRGFSDFEIQEAASFVTQGKDVSGTCCPCDDQSFNLHTLCTSVFQNCNVRYFLRINFRLLGFRKTFFISLPPGEQVVPRKVTAPIFISVFKIKTEQLIILQHFLGLEVHLQIFVF